MTDRDPSPDCDHDATPRRGRPKSYPTPRVATAIRLDPYLHERLKEAAAERDLPVNYLVNAAVRDFLPRLIPVEEFSLTRRPNDRP